MRRRLVLSICTALGVFASAWLISRAAGVPPIRMLVHHGIDYSPAPTGRHITLGGIEFLEVSSGCFLMGSHPEDGGESVTEWVCRLLGLDSGRQSIRGEEYPPHWVEFRNAYWIARTEVSEERFSAWARLDEPEGSRTEAQRPVVMVSWQEAKEHCWRIAEKTGFCVRLPSESEWECACRASRELSASLSASVIREQSWTRRNSGGQLHAVASLSPNDWGLFDSCGNVWEWCEDTFHPSYWGAPCDGGPRTEPRDPPVNRVAKVARGGCALSPASVRLVTIRGSAPADKRLSMFGFRPAFSLRCR